MFEKACRHFTRFGLRRRDHDVLALSKIASVRQLYIPLVRSLKHDDLVTIEIITHLGLKLEAALPSNAAFLVFESFERLR